MGVCGPLRAGLFYYECLRLLALVVFLFVTLSGSAAFSPYLVYLSANALFPLMALFIWLRPEEYRNYLTLYMAGKVISSVSFYVWEFFTFRWGGRAFGSGGGAEEFALMEDAVKSVILLGGSLFVSLADILSVWGAWTLKNKFRQAAAPRCYGPESGGT